MEFTISCEIDDSPRTEFVEADSSDEAVEILKSRYMFRQVAIQEIYDEAGNTYPIPL